MNEAVSGASAAAVPTVPLLDLRAQYRPMRDEIMAAIEQVCADQHFILGPRVGALEKSIAAYSQAAHAIGVSSGTDALLLALMALEIGPGDAVITSPYTFFATGGTIARVGARPIYCDIDPASYNLSPRRVREYLERRCERREGAVCDRASGARLRALMPVHLYGQCADMDALLAIAKDYGLRVIEDAAQAIGAEAGGGRRAGSLGDVGCFSFFPSKNLGAFGDAGMCTAQDDALAERMRILRVHGGKPKYYHSLIGANLRLDELQAAVLAVKLPYLDGWTAARQRNAAHYRDAFARSGLSGDVVGLPPERDGFRHIYNQFVIRVPRRDELRKHLNERNIGTEIYYPVPLHMQKCFEYLGQRAGDCQESERAAAQTLALPVYPELTTAQLDYVVGAIASFYG
jgi:dTDP-4-amino-4,6-dideoxygalactose transaminase